MIRSRKPRQRRGATVVEAAFVLPVVMLFLFGIMEYCRLVFVIQVCENAAREGARYAVARTGDGTTAADIQAYVRTMMAGQDRALSGLTIDLLDVDPTTGTTVSGSDWSDAPFGGAIMVRISGTYSPMIPGLSRLASSLPIRATSMMTSEAN
jgi:Flp pilus assembly protein TadG